LGSEIKTLGVFGVTIREKDIDNVTVDYQSPLENIQTDNHLNFTNLSDIERDILSIIGNEDGIKAIQISKKTDKSQRTIMRNLRKLKEKGFIEYIGTLKTGGYKITFDL